MQTIVSELKQKVAETNSDQAQFQKGLRAEQDRLASASSEITNLRSEVQALRDERSALQTIVSELNQKVAGQGPVCSPLPLWDTLRLVNISAGLSLLQSLQSFFPSQNFLRRWRGYLRRQSYKPCRYRPLDVWKMHDLVTSFSPQNKCVMKNSSNSISTALIPTIPLDYQEYPIEEVQRRALEYYENMKRRRTVRDFSRRKVPFDIIENCLRTADTAPNGANQHPWHFVVVSDPEIKLQIREAAEKEEKDFYKSRASREWLEALAPLGTDEKQTLFRNCSLFDCHFCKGIWS